MGRERRGGYGTYGAKALIWVKPRRAKVRIQRTAMVETKCIRWPMESKRAPRMGAMKTGRTGRD